MKRDIDDEIDLAQRKKHAGHGMYAAACFTQQCFAGTKVVLEKPARKPRPARDRPGVYTISGVDGEWIGLDAVVGKLFDLGVSTPQSTMKVLISKGQKVEGYQVTAHGVVDLRRKAIERQSEK